jgi:hypothetical protein
MSENMLSITISFVILLVILIFVPCLELTARGCQKINRSFGFGRRGEEKTTTSSLKATTEPRNNKKNSRSSDAA